jgi:hypothetical protein
MLVSQAAAVGGAGWIVYLLARRWFRSDWTGLLAMLVLFANPRIQKAVIHDFHKLTVLPLFLALAFFLTERRRWKSLAVVFSAGLFVREDAFFCLMGIPAYLAMRRKWGWSLALSAVAAASAAILFLVLFPAIRHGEKSYEFLSHYAWLGDSIAEIARTILTRPDIVVRHVALERDNSQLMVFLSQFAFLPLLSLKGIALAGPSMLESLLSDSGKLTGYGYHYVAPPVAALTIGTMLTLRVWRARLRGVHCLRWAPAALLASMLAGNIVYSLPKGALPFSTFARRSDVRFDIEKCRRIRAVGALRAGIPAGARVGYAFNIYGRYHGDRNAWPIRSLSEIESRPHDYLLLDTAWHRPIYKNADNKAAVDQVTAGGEWEAVDEKGGVRLLRHKAVFPGVSPQGGRGKRFEREVTAHGAAMSPSQGDDLSSR